MNNKKQRMSLFTDRVIYSVTTDDEYEFPLCIGTIDEIAKFTGVTRSCIVSQISVAKKNGWNCRYHRLYKESEEPFIE